MSIRTNFQVDEELNTARETDATDWTPYVGLITAVSSIPSGSVTEASYQDYARQSVSFDAPEAGEYTNANRQVPSDAVVEFPAKGDAGTVEVTHAGIWDASTSGNLRYVIPLAVSKIVGEGDPVEFPAGSLVLGGS